ncbi:MAG: glycosyltransferase [Verrucomicrobiales bacterium]
MTLYQIILFGLLAWITLGTMLNVLVFPRARASRDAEPKRGNGSPTPLVSILVPARNEEMNIRACLESLKAQDDPNFEVLVLEDRSEDATASLILECGFVEAEQNPHGKFRMIRGTELPEGWAGKPWACHQLAGAAKGEWLLFTDADTLHAPHSVRAAVETGIRQNAGLLSAWPRQITSTWSEKLVIPLLYILTHALLPQVFVTLCLRWPWLARLSGRKGMAALGAANGQFILFQRKTYDNIGGHVAVKNHLVEDVALGRLVMERTADGERLVNCDGGEIVRCRMYRSFGEVWAGFSKNLRPVFGTNAIAFVASGLVQAAMFIGPFVFALLPMPGQVWAVGQVGCLLVMRLILTWRFRTSLAAIPFHPFAYLLALAIALNSWRWAASGKILWKGRVYAG